MIYDLHCDLLAYLECKPSATPFERESLCSIPEMKKGNVKFQVLPIYTMTDNESKTKGMRQFDFFMSLLKDYSDYYFHVKKPSDLDKINEKIGITLAIENASGFCDENETFEEGLKSLKKILDSSERIFYISLTWNNENRFGGGQPSKIGLKEDGKRLLDFMDEENIAVDFSHSSDYLCEDILNYIDSNNLRIPVIASHSNYRNITNHLRNLPDEYVQEIIKRKGLIGLNFVKRFSGDGMISQIDQHLAYGISKGAENAICFGADFFFGFDKYHEKETFYEGLSTSSSYPKALEILKKVSNFEKHEQNMSYLNIKKFFENFY